MRILFIGNFLIGQMGAFSISEAIARRLSARGHHVVLTSRKVNRLLRLADMIFTIIKARKQYDIAHVDVFSGKAFFWAEIDCSILKWLKKPIVLTLHGGNLPDFARRSPSRVRRLFSKAASITVPSSYLFKQMQPYTSRMRALPNPIDCKEFQFRFRSSATPVLLWVRAFHRIYNPVMAINVLALLAEKYPAVHLNMIGRDKGDGSLLHVHEAAHRLGVAEKLSLPGGMDNHEISSWIDRADIFINTTNFDNTPVSVLEAMAGGMCIVSTNAGGIPFLLEHGQDALLVPAGDAVAMTHMISKILSEPALAARLSSNSRKKVERFDWSVILPQWEELLAKMLA